MDTITDDDLVRMHREGDADAFSVLFDRHHVAAYNFALSLLQNVQHAEDILQDSFTAAVRSLPSYEARGHFRCWLMRIVRNRCLNRIESIRSQPLVFDDDVLSRLSAPDSAPSPDAQAGARDGRDLIQKALGRLPDRQREVMALFAFEQMRYAEIAEVLEMPINTVKTLIHRARAFLARELEPLRKEFLP